tara:strand:- start:2057 stop:4789 length:2733 start_codon:yes stop_codon:yes gene_type:complete
MINFLDFVSENIINENLDFHDIKIIVPSNRASLFLRNNLIQKIKKPVISPQIISISEFINELSSVVKIENTSVVFEMYIIYTKIIPKNDQQSFDEFMGWAQVLINDFNLIDSYLVDPKAIFSTLESAQKINEWAQSDYLDSAKSKNINFWKNNSSLYYSLYKKLIKKGVGTIGMQFREAIKNLEVYISQNKKFHYFIGFNMLNTAESNIIQEFISQKKGKVLWDLDKEFFEDKNHPAGKFIRSYYKEWRCLINQYPEGLSSNFQKDKKFNFVETSNKIAQAKYVGQIINKDKDFNPTIKKGIVLGDDEILSPVLSGISIDKSKWNVTMGLSIQNFSSISFLDMIFQMHINAVEGNYFFEDVFSILKDNIVIHELNKKKLDLVGLIKNLENSNHTIFSCQNLYSDQTSFQYILFRPIVSSFDLLEKIKTLIIYLEEENNVINGQSTMGLFNIIKIIILKILEYSDRITDIPLKVLFLLYQESLKEQKLNFSGDSGSQIQIMTLPETRLIDFDSVILTNVNEGILPKGKNNDSFLPFDLKKYFKLPTFLEQDAKYAYQFYRLIQNSTNVYLLYSISDKGLGGSEKSRFIYQLEYFAKLNHELKFIKVKSFFKNTPSFKVEKSNDIINILKTIVKKGLSPSVITSFMINPLDFYYNRILKIKEGGKLSPVIEPRDKGNIVHETLEDLYKPYLSKELTVKNYQEILINLPTVLDKKYKLIYGGNPERKGHNFLIYEELKKQCEEFLKTEKSLVKKGNKLKILSLEKKIEYLLEFKELKFPVKIIGTIDRVDEWNGELRISDYKTGSVKKDKLKFYSNFTFEDLNFEKSLDYAPLFQLLLYSYVYFKQNSCKTIRAGIIPIKNPNDYFYLVTTSAIKENKNLLSFDTFKQFEIELIAVIKKLFNEKTPFMANDSK